MWSRTFYTVLHFNHIKFNFYFSAFVLVKILVILFLCVCVCFSTNPSPLALIQWDLFYSRWRFIIHSCRRRHGVSAVSCYREVKPIAGVLLRFPGGVEASLSLYTPCSPRSLIEHLIRLVSVQGISVNERATPEEENCDYSPKTNGE